MLTRGPLAPPFGLYECPPSRHLTTGDIMKEADLQKRIVQALRAYSGYWVVIHGTPYQQGGLPDIIGCYAGYFFGLEVKLPGKEHTLTARQSHVLDQIRKAGGKSALVTSINQAMDFVFGSSP